MSEHPRGIHTRGMAEYIARGKKQDIPADVVDWMKLLTLDTIGCGLLGSSMPWTHRLIDTMSATEAPGPALVWGHSQRFSAKHAALINGSAVHGFELDDVGAQGHWGSVNITAALALAEAGAELSGRDLIAATVTGVEIGARVGECVGRVPHVTVGFHGPGVFGTFGAMASAAVVLNLDAERAVHALGHASQQAGGLMGTHHGGMGKRLLAGQAARSGVFAAELAAHGFTNVDNIFECGYGSFPSAFSGARDTFDLNKLDAGFGEKWLSRGVNFKVWACRVPIHPSMEAIKGIRKRETLNAADVEKVRVALPEGSFRAVGFPYTPTTITSAQLNLQYCIAIMLLENDVFVGQFTEEKIKSPAVMDLVRRIEIVYDPALDGEVGGGISRETHIVVTLKDGRELAQTGLVRGTNPEDKITRGEIVDKFRKTSAGVIDDSTADRLIALCDDLENLKDAKELVKLLAVPAR